MIEFIKKCFWYLVENKVLGITVCALTALILISIIVLIVKSAKNRKANKKAKKLSKQETATPKKVQKQAVAVASAPAPAPKQKPLTAEEKEALRRATLERLEREEQEALAEEQALKQAEEEALRKAEEERLAKEEAIRKAQEKEEQAKAKASTPKKSLTKPEKAEKPVEKPAKKQTVAKKPVEKKTEESLYDTLASASTLKPDFEDESEIEKASKYSGKWSIYRVITGQADEEETYFFELLASNGEKLLSSEEYTSYNGALRGIETHKANIEKGNFKITISKKGDFIFKLLSGKNLLLCMGENYPTKPRCESAIESTKRFAKTAVLDESVHDLVIKVPVEDDADVVYDLPDGYNGKWIISHTKGADGETVYYFELFANNGEKLLSSEEYTTYVGAVNGIGTHKANIEKGNFRISLTKRGDYIYKLLNGNGQLLCLGEHYKTKRRCQNAVESVKRFAKNSPVLADSATITK